MTALNLATAPSLAQQSHAFPAPRARSTTPKSRGASNGSSIPDKSFYDQQCDATVSAIISSRPVAENNPDNHSTTDCEIWKPVVGYEGLYEVSNHGRVKTLRTSGRGIGACKSYPYLSLRVASQYLLVTLCENSKATSHLVHKLVATAFIGPCPDGYDVNHIDLKKTNNHADNLEYLTRSYNLQHAVGVRGQWSPCGEDSPNSKLSNQQTGEIRQLLADGISQRQIAQRYGVSQPTISYIKRGLPTINVEDVLVFAPAAAPGQAALGLEV